MTVMRSGVEVDRRATLLFLRAGLGLLALFWRPAAAVHAADATKYYGPRRCPQTECGHVHDPAVGEPEQGIPPGIAFEDLPEDWECPNYGTSKHLW
jgi:rubredoxin